MPKRVLMICLTVLGLSGCQWLPMAPDDDREAAAPEQEAVLCDAEVPGFKDAGCMLQEWVALGLASQRGDKEWRSDMLARLDGEQSETRLARAVTLAWGPVSQWKQASELLKADLEAAPPRLQPLLQFWLNELERRRELQYRLYKMVQESEALETEKQALDEKLDAMTDIERNINSRQ
ncbi:hypothetical protein OM427_30050 [Halomonas sp. 18H]|uniref:hypothetical protein n=1 Tax=Halomonas almeriensis TaxID=308163 RepID=UPI00222F2879|nr:MULTISPECIES: hypothetical protein [Halomonas]MCW4153748.1 hypothetical protein [Halomonas sp. 18H]MDN3552097.1 hypothetical protein [Halomonas almeriensis]